jgi:molybdate transport system substrate-binding protein
MMTRTGLTLAAAMVGLSLCQPGGAAAADIKILTAGAMRAVVLAVLPEFERQTGHKVGVDNDTVGGLTKRVDGGERFDVVIMTPAAVDNQIKSGRVADGTRTPLAKVGIGVAVKEGAAKPDISTVEAFKRMLLAAKSVTYVDPKAGGSSGIYFAGLLQKLGIADEIRPKERLLPGGYVAELVAKGEVEVAIHQISEIVPVKGVTLVGPLPAEIQNFTVYAAGISTAAGDAGAAKALVEHHKGPSATAVLKDKGMERP